MQKSKQFFTFVLLVWFIPQLFAQDTSPIINYVGYRGGIDIGSQGIKLSIMGFYYKNDRLKYRLVYERQESIGLVKGMETNSGKLRPSDIQDAIAFAQEMVEDAKEAYKLTTRDFVMYTSSGVNLAPNVNELDALAKKNMGMGVNTSLTAKAESAYGARASFDRDDFDSAILVDVGGGNSKGGILQKYIAADGREKYTFKAFSIEYGARRLNERLAKRSPNFEEYQRQLRAMVEDTLAKLIRSNLNDNPSITSANRTTIYLTGGAAYQFITWLYPEKIQEEIVEFKYADLLNFEYLLRREGGWKSFESRTFDTVFDEKLRSMMKKDHEKATQKVYNRDACLTGIMLIEQVLKEIGNIDKKIFYFSRDAYWINIIVYDAFKNDFKR